MKSLWQYNMPVGRVYIIEQYGAISHVLLGEDERAQNCEARETELIKRTAAQLAEYFDGKRREFEVPLIMIGTNFQKEVWKALETIPFGQTRTYKDIAEQIGNSKASRAVGGANNRNPISIIVPCHRVIGANGSLVGYAGGLDIKRKLLCLEGIDVRK